MAKEVALVEDDQTLRQNYVDQLEDAGFTVRSYADRVAAEADILKKLPDLALLDIGLHSEREGGFELCRNIRKVTEFLPIIFLTSYDKDVDEISALRLGADDFISKDESFEKILVRIDALLRRVTVIAKEANDSPTKPPLILEQGELKIDMARYEVHWKHTSVRLPLTQLWILQALVLHPGQFQSREALMYAANITHSGTGTIPVHINSIRNKFKQVDTHFNHIVNERGIGYKWREE